MSITPKQAKAIEVIISDGGTYEEIAKKINASKNSIYAWFKDDDFLAALNRAQLHAFSIAASKAHRKLIELLDSPNPSVALGACNSLLDRAGYKAVQRIDADVNAKQDITVVIEGVGGDIN